MIPRTQKKKTGGTATPLTLVQSEALDSLIVAGRALSNICYNLKQQEILNPQWRQSMNSAVGRWDKANRVLLQAAVTASVSRKANRPKSKSSSKKARKA